MIVLEFNGLPGSGKTTVSDNLVKKIKENNKNVITLSDVLYNTTLPFYNRYIQLVISLLSWRDFIINLYTIRLFLRFRINKESIIFLTRFIILNHKLGRMIKKNNYDVLILEEGIIQYLTSIPHDKRVCRDKVTKALCLLLKNKFSDIVHIQCEIDINNCVKRIQSRKNPNNRFDQVEGKKLFKLLKVKEYNLNIVRSLINNQNNIKINTRKDMAYNTTFIYELITDYL